MSKDDRKASADATPTIASIFASADALVRRRAVEKRKITLAVKSAGTDINSPAAEIARESVRSSLQAVEDFDAKIVDELIVDCGDQEELNKRLDKEVQEQTNYKFSIQLILKRMSPSVEPSTPSVPPPATPPTSFEVKLPNLNCATFSGEGAAHLDYYSFITQFKNIVGSRENLSKCSKFTYLKSYLRGYALKLVQHLQISDSNYDIALELLENEFHNKEAVIDSFIKKLLTLRPKFDKNLP